MPSVTLIFPNDDLVRRAEGLAHGARPTPLTQEQRARVRAVAEAEGQAAANRLARELQGARGRSRMQVLVEAVALGIPLLEAAYKAQGASAEAAAQAMKQFGSSSRAAGPSRSGPSAKGGAS